MQIKQWFRDVTRFNKKDRIGAVVFAVVIAGSIFFPRLLAPPPNSIALEPDTALRATIDTLQQRQARTPSYPREEYSRGYQYGPSTNQSFTHGELFQFDPNTTSLQDWQRLGLREKTGKTILNYVSKGGKFYKPEDLQKIWGLPKGFYERVKDYVVITPVQRSGYTKYDENKPVYEKKERKPAIININDADTAAFISLPGIGSKLSARIVAFREKLGGFYSVDQIGETYGLPDSTFQNIKSRLQTDGSELKKINVNTATKEDLKGHPYIRWKLANAIVEYRNQHGAFKSLDELKNIMLLDEATYEKIVHYLSL